jgi:hypothetical protein
LRDGEEVRISRLIRDDRNGFVPHRLMACC